MHHLAGDEARLARAATAHRAARRELDAGLRGAFEQRLSGRDDERATVDEETPGLVRGDDVRANGREALDADPILRHAERGEIRDDGVHHRLGAADVDARPRGIDAGERFREVVALDAAHLRARQSAGRALEDGSHFETVVVRGEVGEGSREDHVVVAPVRVDERHLRVRAFERGARDAEERRDPATAADEDETIERLGRVVREAPGRTADTEDRPGTDVLVEPRRPDSALDALHGDDERRDGIERRRRDRVRATDLPPRDREDEGEELSRDELDAARALEDEAHRVLRLATDLEHAELPLAGYAVGADVRGGGRAIRAGEAADEHGGVASELGRARRDAERAAEERDRAKHRCEDVFGGTRHDRDQLLTEK